MKDYKQIKKRLTTVAIVLVVSILLALPVASKQFLPDVFLVDLIKNSSVNLGLDLKGGTRLQYGIDLRGVPEENKTQIVEGVVGVLEGRVNDLGVSEPNIYESQIGNETNIVVELAGVDSIEAAKQVVGKVIQLEFKETNENPENTQEEVMSVKANEILREIREEPENFREVAGKNFEKDIIEYNTNSFFYDEIPESFRDVVWNADDNEILNRIYSADLGFEQSGGQIVAKKGLFIVKKDSEEEVLRDAPKNAEALSEIANNDNASFNVYTDENFKNVDSKVANKLEDLKSGQISDTFDSSLGKTLVKLNSKLDTDKYLVKVRQIALDKEALEATKVIEEGLSDEEKASIENENAQIEKRNELTTQRNIANKERLESLREQIENNRDAFERLARLNSADEASANLGGNLGYISEGTYSSSFDSVVFNSEIGTLSSIIEGDNFYHLVEIIDIKDSGENVGTFEVLSVCYESEGCELSEEEAQTIIKDFERRAKLEKRVTYEEIFFSTTPSPWILAKDSQGRNLTGQYFERANVEFNEYTGQPVVNINFNSEGSEIFEEITERNVGKPLAIFVGGQLISAPRINEKIPGGTAIISGNFNYKEAVDLVQNLNTGAIPAPISLVGQEKIGASIGLLSFDLSVYAGIIGLVLVILYMSLYYKASGVIASISLVLYMIILYAALSLFGVTLTLAGVAGIILSIGLAVDANVLIFERMKEELAKGEVRNQAIEKGFVRARKSIMASNLSTLLTAVILYVFGSSIITGFAFALILGILVSLFSAIYISHTLLLVYDEKVSSEKWFV